MEPAEPLGNRLHIDYDFRREDPRHLVLADRTGFEERDDASDPDRL